MRPNLGYAAVFMVLGLTMVFVVAHTAASAAASTPTMVEGRVVSVAQASFTMETVPTGPFCRPPLMCPDFIAAPREYVVDYSSSTVFAGNSFGAPQRSPVSVGDEVVVYGLLTPLALPEGTPNSKQPQIMWPLPRVVGTIAAQGVYLLSPMTWPCWGPLATPKCLPMMNPGGPEKSPTSSMWTSPRPVTVWSASPPTASPRPASQLPVW